MFLSLYFVSLTKRLYLCTMKLQKIMIDAGFTCPNRDGKVGTTGCSFCRNDSFNPAYCQGTITEQLEAGKRFLGQKYPQMKYLAYFQAYSNTYAPIHILRERYTEALRVKDVVGLVIATRPDCIADETLQYLSELSQQIKAETNCTFSPVTIELGIESMYDRTLRRIHRGHNVETSVDAIKRCTQAGLEVGVHLIIGLPGETEADILAEADLLNALPIHSLKLHQLQILKDTPIEQEWQQNPEDFLPLSLDAYARLAAHFISKLNPSIHVERYASSSPKSLLVSPHWGVKPSVVEQKVLEYLNQFNVED